MRLPFHVALLSGAKPFSPASLFSAGEQGVWYDPSDFNTMFQDSAGATPVTAVEQPVGLIRDKSGRGNHASQSTAASRPVLSARVNQLLATATLSTQSVNTLAGTYTLAFNGTGTVTTSGTNVGVYSAGLNSLICTAGTLTLTVAGLVTLADLRATNDGVGLPAYQAVVTSTDYDTVNFPLYLRFDGVDDTLVTANIDFTATDKVGVFTGVRKLSDGGAGYILQLSTTQSSNSSFGLTSPLSSTNYYRFTSKGTLYVIAVTPSAAYAGQVTNVATGIGDIGNDKCILRLNGFQEASTATDQGTGNYGNYPLYIGSRVTFPYNGRIYSIIVRGAQSDEAQIVSTETYVNNLTKAY